MCHAQCIIKPCGGKGNLFCVAGVKMKAQIDHRIDIVIVETTTSGKIGAGKTIQ